MTKTFNMLDKYLLNFTRSSRFLAKLSDNSMIYPVITVVDDSPLKQIGDFLYGLERVGVSTVQKYSCLARKGGYFTKPHLFRIISKLLRRSSMKLKRCNQILHYEGGKITEYELLTRYNPRFINSKIQAIQYQINAVYSLNQSHVVSCDVRGFITVSYPVDKLVIWIIEQKEALERYKTASSGNLATLKRVVSRYTPQEQKDIIRYMASNGRYRPIGVIERLQVDLYRTVNNARQKRNRGRREAHQRAVYKHVALIKQTINKERVAM